MKDNLIHMSTTLVLPGDYLNWESNIWDWVWIVLNTIMYYINICISKSHGLQAFNNFLHVITFGTVYKVFNCLHHVPIFVHLPGTASPSRSESRTKLLLAIVLFLVKWFNTLLYPRHFSSMSSKYLASRSHFPWTQYGKPHFPEWSSDNKTK